MWCGTDGEKEDRRPNGDESVKESVKFSYCSTFDFTCIYKNHLYSTFRMKKLP